MMKCERSYVKFEMIYKINSQYTGKMKLPTWNIANSFFRVQYLAILHHLQDLQYKDSVKKQNKLDTTKLILLLALAYFD